MKSYSLFVVLCFYISLIYTQPNTEIYVFDLSINDDKISLSNPKNISNNEGYDNQPSFIENTKILFAATRSDQTDIRLFDIEAGSSSAWITDTPTGSEYSPLKIPNKNAVSAIRLDLNGLQRLYKYDMNTGSSEPILKDLKVGYHVWYSTEILVCTVLIENRMDLVVYNLKDKTTFTVYENVGRSLSKIPNTDLISFISKQDKQWVIKSLNPITHLVKTITKTFRNSEDISWLANGSLITGSGKSIYKIKPLLDTNWEVIQKFNQAEINNITRIAISEDAKRLAFVAEESPEKIVQKQLDAYNARDINRFIATFADNIELLNYPNKEFLKGKQKMKESYAGYFEATPDLNCEIKNRIVIGNKVIDEEYITANGQNFSAVAIYEVENGKITKVTFIR